MCASLTRATCPIDFSGTPSMNKLNRSGLRNGDGNKRRGPFILIKAVLVSLFFGDVYLAPPLYFSQRPH